MKIHDQCLPCLVNQVVKVANMSGVSDAHELYRKTFAYMSTIDFDKTNPEIIGDTFRLLKEHTGCKDPYYETRKYYNEMFLEKRTEFRQYIENTDYPFERAMVLSILGNIIDFSPIHNQYIEDVMTYFTHFNKMTLSINHRKALLEDLAHSKELLYLGDNCGEICLDYLMLEQIKKINPNIHISFGVRGAPVVNDSIEEDAYFVGIDDYADIISNGDDSLGTVLSRVSPEFLAVYNQADVVIAKGQANFECLSEEKKNIYFLLMTKCEVIAKEIGIPANSMVCLSQKEFLK